MLFRSNILVDQTCHARLADFGLLTIVSESTASSSVTEGGTTRWMSPELFGSEDHQQTKGSDCYALGMVIYEVLSRRKPFYQYKDFTIVGRVIKGERPERPQGPEGVVGFTDAVWEMLELCWKSLPQERPSIEDVLKCMKKAATSWTPPSPLSTTVSSAADSPTSDTSVIGREESEDADEGEAPLLSQLSDGFSVPTAVSSAADSPTSDTFVIAREESEDANEGEVPLPSQPSNESPVSTSVPCFSVPSYRTSISPTP